MPIAGAAGGISAAIPCASFSIILRTAEPQKSKPYPGFPHILPKRPFKRLQAEQLADIAEQARRVLEQRQSEDALRAQMDAQLVAQRADLEKQAGERRAELDRLRLDADAELDVWAQLETIVGINRNISEIESRFDEAAAQMEEEVKALYDQRADAVMDNNPKEPFETQAEYDKLIAGMTAEIRAEQRAELGRRRAELKNARREQLSGIEGQLRRSKAELSGSRFTLGAAAARVSVANFNAEEKRFPMEVRAEIQQAAFTVPVSYTLKGRGRDALRDEYYQVYSADQSGGLAGEITYTVFELYPDVWVFQPVETRVLNLLENDLELTRSGGGKGAMAVSTAGEGKPIATVLRLESGTGSEAEVKLNGKAAGRTGLTHIAEDEKKLGTVRAEYIWPGV